MKTNFCLTLCILLIIRCKHQVHCQHFCFKQLIISYRDLHNEKKCIFPHSDSFHAERTREPAPLAHKLGFRSVPSSVASLPPPLGAEKASLMHICLFKSLRAVPGARRPWLPGVVVRLLHRLKRARAPGWFLSGCVDVRYSHMRIFTLERTGTTEGDQSSHEVKQSS